MTSAEIRTSFLTYFEERGHRIVPSAPVIPHGDPTLFFTNAGMNQFKDVFLGTGKREYVRAADTQKCIRVSGKHNDLEEVGRDTYHHTFFEMLGNWSFGDYYKREAIGWAWELLTEKWGLEKKRLYATVYRTDDEAAELWKKVTDIDPTHILRFGDKENFWEMGKTGPCGPCSEIHIDLTPDYSGGPLVNLGDPRVMEIWNLVFIQNNRIESGDLENLPARHVDTGMGFERVCAVMQGKPSNYDTDVFMPIIDAIAKRTGRPYKAEADQVAMRVIADHIRMLTFSIGDGAIPGNDGRGYVLRRILRRAARFGRNLGMREPFIHEFTADVVASMGKAFPDIVAKKDHVMRVIRAEEESFDATLDRGLEIFESVLARSGGARVFPGDEAFKLFDTYGFPLDLTELIASERGLSVDSERFTVLMKEQQTRAREAGKGEAMQTASGILARLQELPESKFIGYDSLETPARVNRFIDGKYLALDRTPFYTASGGQVDDTGIIESAAFTAEVIDSFRQDNHIIHEVRFTRGAPPTSGAPDVVARVDTARRAEIQRNHSATHLVHEALRRVLGDHVHQQGSLVEPERLRFDFPHFGKMTRDEIRAVEDLVNERIALNVPVQTEVDIPITQAKKIPNVKMFFGDKYGDIVRVVVIDERFSVEFCGGTHVKNTSDIGYFKIIAESGIASGVRRIEAVTGNGVQRYIDEQLAKVHTAQGTIERLLSEKEAVERELASLGTQIQAHPRPSLGSVVLSPSQPKGEAIGAIEKAMQEREQVTEHLERETLQLKKTLGSLKLRAASGGIDDMVAKAHVVSSLRVVASRVEAADMDALKGLGDALREKIGSGVGVLAAVIDEKVALVCVVSDDLVAGKKIQAGKIVGAVAKLVGGGGGGKPHLATAGGKDVGAIDTALAQVPSIVGGAL